MSPVGKKIITISFDGVLYPVENVFGVLDNKMSYRANAGSIDFLSSASLYFEVHIYSEGFANEQNIARARTWLLDNGLKFFYLKRISFVTHPPVFSYFNLGYRTMAFNGTFPTLESIDEYQPALTLDPQLM
jgi:hypothetical protein